MNCSFLIRQINCNFTTKLYYINITIEKGGVMQTIISQEQIEELKKNHKKMSSFISTENSKKLSYLLCKLGKLPDKFNKSSLVFLLNHEDKKIRCLAVKNLGKLNDFYLYQEFKKILLKDRSADVRREATSSIGRLRDKKTIPFLLTLLKDDDPEVVLQAVRGLLVFRKKKLILSALKKLARHPNEIIQDVISKELYSEKDNKEKTNHIRFPEKIKNKIILGDTEKVLKYISDESIHLTFTSPPYYNARDYSIYKSYSEYLKFLEKVFKEVYRITKDGRFFVLNTSPIIIPRAGRKYSSKRYPIPYDIHYFLIKMGWEFIDDIVWLKPEASVKNRNAGFLQHRKPMAYKPNARTEMVMVYRKKTKKLIDWNIKQYSQKTIDKSKVKGDYETSNVWKIDPVFDKTHSAIFPLELCNRVIKFYSFKGDLVLDPFAGSGTLGKSAINNERSFLLIEKDQGFFERIKENIGFIDSEYMKLSKFKKT